MKKYKCMVMVTAMVGLVRAVWCDDGDRVFGVRKRKKRRRGRGGRGVGRGVGRGNRGRRKRRRRREVEEQEYEEEARQPGRRMTRTDKKTETRCHSQLWYV